MALITGRAREAAQVTIDQSRCSGCGLCVGVCPGFPLHRQNGQVAVDQSRGFGCIGCGHCMAICPRDCVKVSGRDLSPADLVDLPGQEKRADYAALQALCLARRSTRAFLAEPVDRYSVDRILATVATAPMGLPPSDVAVLVLAGPEKVREFAGDVVAVIRKWKWLFSPVVLSLLAPFISRETREVMNSFVYPAAGMFVEKWNQGEDWLLYGAPLAMYFHCSPYADPVDTQVAATYAMLAGESLGLGTCMIGSVAPFLGYSNRLKDKYGIPRKNRQGVMVLFGQPRFHYPRGVRRRLADVCFYGGT